MFIPDFSCSGNTPNIDVYAPHLEKQGTWKEVKYFFDVVRQTSRTENKC